MLAAGWAAVPGVLLVAVLLSGCGGSAGRAFAQGLAEGLQSPAYAPTPAPQPNKIMLFGGPGHRTYLGCLSCQEYATDSVFNEYSSHGSRYRGDSIWNRYGQFGSDFSSYSACSMTATDPPVIVDRGGRFYGRLTRNEFHSQVTRNQKLLRWLGEVVCE